ncbi:MAG: corrinoid protein [bacterium]|nr:corrinoid protein [bacterium]
MCVREIARAVCEGDDDIIVVRCQEALQRGVEPSYIMKEGLTAGMMEAGKLFDDGEYFLPEMLISSMTLQKGLDFLMKDMQEEKSFWKGRIVIGTVEGDMHDIGKNLVVAMLRVAGFEVIDLGIDVSAKKFMEAIRTYKPDIVALSALLSTTMMNMQTIIQQISENGLRNEVKIMIGGAVVNQRFAEQIGADGYSENASQAVILAEKLMG